MTPISLGIFASANTTVAANTSFESIATATPNNASVTFSSIPSGYTHLQIRGIVRSATYNGAGDYFSIRINGDSSGNYNAHGLYGNQSSALTFGRSGNQTEIFAGEYAGAAASSGIFGGIILDILDYGSTDKYKTVRYLVGNDRNGAGQIMLASGLWKSTSAITSITLTGYFGGGFAQYSRLALYGIKTA